MQQLGSLINLNAKTPQAQPTIRRSPLLLGETPLGESLEAQNQLTMLLQQTYACQKTYADKAEMMEYRDGMFQVVLAEYAFFEVKKAFMEYVKRSSDLPTPSDIVKLINEDRRYRFMTEPTIDIIKGYKEKGIPLTQSQQDRLSYYEATGVKVDPTRRTITSSNIH